MPRTTITTAAGRGQAFLAEAAVTFIWSALPARTEWRYSEASYKVIALDAGHVCQNLYLACEAIGAGTCAIAAYSQELCDELSGRTATRSFPSIWRRWGRSPDFLPEVGTSGDSVFN